MSSHKVLVTTIDSVTAHPNADRLDLVQVGGWVCVTGKGAFKAGDKCVYIPIDSVLGTETERLLFPEGSKITLSKSRVKTAKIRGCVSQGMAVTLDAVGLRDLPVGKDVAEALKITKYEPPRKPQTGAQGTRRATPKTNPHFVKYTDLENIKNYMNVFEPGELVYVTEKIHGTNFRAGWVPFVPRTLWHRVQKFFGKAPEWEFVYGSRNVQLQDTPKQKTWLQNKGKTVDNVYAKTVEKYNLRNRIPKGVVMFGEIYGPDIQPGYHYGCKPGEYKLAIFDLYLTEEKKYVDVHNAESRMINYKMLDVWLPPLVRMPFDIDKVKELAKGDSILAPSQKVREGVVVKPRQERMGYCGRVILKVINDDYLLSKHADEEVAHDQVPE